MALTPSISGMRRSMRMTSGGEGRARRTASTRRWPRPRPRSRRSPANIPLSPLRTTGWSSTIISRIGALMSGLPAPPPGWRRRWRCRHRARIRSRACRPRLDPLAHPGQPEAAVVVARAPRPGAVDGDEADAVVANVEGHEVGHVGQGEPDAASRWRAWRRWPAPPGRCATAPPRSRDASPAASPVRGEGDRPARAARTSAGRHLRWRRAARAGERLGGERLRRTGAPR